MIMKIKGAIDRSRPGVSRTTPCPTLSNEQQCEMDQAVAMLREAADQGHMEAQAHCGDLYELEWGVAKDDGLSFVYNEKAAQQGNAVCQSNLGGFYLHGRGCEINYERAAEWLKRAASTGGMRAQCMLAQLHEYGDGVAKDYLEARRLYTLSSAQGFAPTTDLLKRLEETIRTDCPLLGKRVRITGTSRGDLNGRVGVARSFDEAKGRYVVRLRGVAKTGDTLTGEPAVQEIKVKPENLKSA